MKILDFNENNKYPYSDRNGEYGGQAGLKDGILIDGERWILKYPKSTKNMDTNNGLRSYTTASMSEYIGSHIFNILGIPAHETILGVKNDRVVVACKDFCDDNSRLVEVRTLKNTGSSFIGDELEEINSSTSGDGVDIDELFVHFNKNPFISKIEGIKERFWDQVIIDIYINNSDRNNGNWGVIRRNGYSDMLAPVYDNGNSFHNKFSIEKIGNEISDIKKLKEKLIGITSTIYFSEGKHLSPKKILSFSDEILEKEINKLVPVISEKKIEIEKFIDDIPYEYKGHKIITDVEKEFYKICLDTRLETFLHPVFMTYKNRECNLDSKINEALYKVDNIERQTDKITNRNKER